MAMDKCERVSWEELFLSISIDLSKRSNCIRRHYGCVIVDPAQHYILATGFNGTPRGMPNCFEGGCPRCLSDSTPGSDYDLCRCIHAEENAILMAAFIGISIKNSNLYVNGRPCLACLKKLIQCGVQNIYYIDGDQLPHRYLDELEEEYYEIMQLSKIKLLKIDS